MFRGVRTVKAFRAEDRELKRYRAMNEDYMANSMKMVRARALISAATTGFSYVALGVVLAIVGYLNLKHGLFTNGGRMMEFFLAVGLVYSNVRRVARAVGVVQESAGAADRLNALLSERVDLATAAAPRPVSAVGSGIHFEDVRLRYPGADQEALCGVTLDIRPGETLALVGPSGAGKTTLIDLVARFIDPTAGCVLVDGVDLRELDLDDWTELFAMVGQQPFLFHTTIYQNILYGRPDASRADVEAAATAANLHEFILGLPEGYETIVGDDGAHLSGGQRQRLTIARAILKGAPVLLLDEATSALDSESEGRRPGSAHGPDEGSHRDRDRPPPLHGPRSRPHRLPRRRPPGRARHPRRAPPTRRHVRAPVRDAVRPGRRSHGVKPWARASTRRAAPTSKRPAPRRPLRPRGRRGLRRSCP